jgi:carbon monoxide dehydrogenase subunit G
VSLEELDGGSATRLSYEVEAAVTGKIAQLGSRLIESTAKKLAGKFFDEFVRLLSPQEEAPQEEAPQEDAPEEKPA